jgi:hypothetical protein
MMTKDEALKMAGYDLDGVIADVEKFDGFDDVCLQTIKRVRSVIDEALEAEQVCQAQEVKDTIFSNYNENISKQVWNTKSGLEGTEFEITDDLK